MTGHNAAAGRQVWAQQDRLDLDRTLGPVRRAIGLQRLLRFTVMGLIAGLILGVLLLVAAHLHHIGVASIGAATLCILGAAAGAAFGASRWPDPFEAARAADLHFGLEDRLTTALELRSAGSSVAVLQSREVAGRIEGVPLTRSRGPWLRRHETVIAAAAVLAFAGALALQPATPGHTASGDAAAKSQAAARKAAAKRLQQLTAKLESGLTPEQRRSEPVRRLELALAKLRRQLLQSTTPLNALRTISTTQQQLRQLARSLHPINSQAVAQLNNSLGRYLQGPKSGGKSGSGTRAQSAAAMAQALNRLAQSLSHLTPSQRAALAQALAKAANTTSNTTMRSALRQAASALANGDPRSAQSALQNASQSLAQSSAAQAALSRLNASQGALDSLKNAISGPAGALPPNPGRGANSAGTQPAQGTGQGRTGTRSGAGKGAGQGRGRQPGKGQGQGVGRGRGRGRGVGTGQGTRGTRGNGRGTGRGTGQGTANRRASGTSGARGRGGQGQSRASRSGHNLSVYVPGKQGKGPEMVRLGPNGAPEPGVVVPYQQVLGKYTQSAHQALDRSALPPALQGDVRRYFSTLSH